MLAPVLLHSAAGPLSAAASLPTPGPHRWQLLRATGKGATACGRWWGLPSGPLGRPTRPQRPAGRTPAHPGRRAAARPVHPPAGAGRGNVAAKAGPLRAPARSSWPPAVARGHPSAMQGQAPAGRAEGPALHCSSPVPVAAQVLRGGPAPTVWGLWGRPPLRPRPSGGRSGPGPLAGGAAPQPSRGPGCGLLLQPLPLRGAAIQTPPARAPQAGPLPALRAAGARRTPAAAGYLTGDLMPRPSPCGAGRWPGLDIRPPAR